MKVRCHLRHSRHGRLLDHVGRRRVGVENWVDVVGIDCLLCNSVS